MGDRYPDRLEIRVLEHDLVMLTTKAVTLGELSTDQALKILRIFRFAMTVIDYARDRLNR